MKSTHLYNQKLSYIEGLLSIILNILLFALKYWAGIVSGSIAMIADAWHTLSDSISSLFVLIGARVSAKPPDERHPFGHGRAELVTAILIGMFLAFIAYEFALESIGKLTSGDKASFGVTALIVTIVSILVKEGMAQFAFWAYHKTGRSSLRADAWHHRTDALSSVLILIGIFIGRFYWWADGVLGILVAIMIAYSAVDIIREAIDPLLGKIPDKKMLAKIDELCKTHSPDMLETHHYHIHEYGDHTEITFHLVFPSHYSLLQAHKLANEIELDIRETYNIEATIHMEPKGEEKDYRPEKHQIV